METNLTEVYLDNSATTRCSERAKDLMGREQHRGVVFRNYRRAGNHGMSMVLEKLQEHRAQLGGMIGLHGWSLLLAKCGWWRLYRKAAKAAHTGFPNYRGNARRCQ